MKTGAQKGGTLAAAVLGALGVAPVATAEPMPAERTASLEEIVVTAQRREEKLQDVPIAITALTAEALLERGVVDFGSYIRTVPGAALAELGTQGNEIKFRGVGNGTAQLSPTTAVYLGEVPVIHTGRSVNSSYNFRLVDIERVEVLRGPQGQLYGANSLGAAIKNVPASPELDGFGLRGSVGGSGTQDGGDGWNADLTLNLPLVEGRLAARVTGYYAEEGGWYDNIYAGGTALTNLVRPGAPLPLTGPFSRIPYAALGQSIATNPAIGTYAAPANLREDVNSSAVTGARGLLRWVVSDTVSAELMLAWEEKDIEGTTWATHIPNVAATAPLYPAFPPIGFAGFQGPPRVVVPNSTTTSPISYFYPTDARRYQQAGATTALASDEIFLANLVVDWDLGFAGLRTSLAYWDRTEKLDTDLSIFGFLNAGVHGAIPAVVRRTDNPTNLIQEVRLTSQGDGPFRWLAGLYHEKIDQDYEARNEDRSGLDIFWQNAVSRSRFNLGPAPTSRLWGLQDMKFTDEQFAVYGEAGWRFTSTLDAAVSFRWFDLDQTASIVNSGFQYQGQPNTSRTNADRVFTPKANLTWRPLDGQMYYLTAAQGYRTGITNNDVPLSNCTQELAAAGTPGGLRPTEPDTLWNYELGAKFELADRRVTVNAAVFRIDWKDLQSQVIMSQLAQVPSTSACTFPAIFNVGKARIEGVELEVAAKLADSLRLNASFANTDARYRNDYRALGIAADSRMQGTPQMQGSLGLQYEFAFGERAGYARVDWVYTGKIPNAGNDFRTQAAPFATAGKFDTIGARAGLSVAEGVRLEVYGDNLTNEYGVTRQFDVAGGQAPTVFTIRPRSYGAALRVQF